MAFCHVDTQQMNINKSRRGLRWMKKGFLNDDEWIKRSSGCSMGKYFMVIRLACHVGIFLVAHAEAQHIINYPVILDDFKCTSPKMSMWKLHEKFKAINFILASNQRDQNIAIIWRSSFMISISTAICTDHMCVAIRA